MRLEIDVDLLAEEVATRVAARLADRIAPQATFRGWRWTKLSPTRASPLAPSAIWWPAGRIRAHGGRRKLFHRDELDIALGHGSDAELRLVPDRAP